MAASFADHRTPNRYKGRERQSGPVALFPGGQQDDGVREYVAELLELRSRASLSRRRVKRTAVPILHFDMQNRPCHMIPATIIKQAAPSRSSYSGQTERRVSRRTR